MYVFLNFLRKLLSQAHILNESQVPINFIHATPACQPPATSQAINKAKKREKKNRMKV